MSKRETQNVICGICSLILPGLGQLIKGKVLPAIFWFFAVIILTGAIYQLVGPQLSILGWVPALYCAYDAYKN